MCNIVKTFFFNFFFLHSEYFGFDIKHPLFLAKKEIFRKLQYNPYFYYYLKNLTQ